MIRRHSLLITFLPCLLAAQEIDLPIYVLELPASVETVLIAETGTATLHRFRYGQDGLEKGDRKRMSVGQNGVGKQRAGDQRTPLGIYFVAEHLDTNKLHEKYGPIAFPLDYPNVWDRANNRTGDGIWIHGVTPNSGPRPVLDTDGCIVVPNEHLLILEVHLTPLQTPVIVTRSIQRASREEIALSRAELMSALKVWSDSYRVGDWHQYLSLYAQEFEYRGMSREEWFAYRIRSVGGQTIEGFSVDNIMLLADPEEPGLYLSRFRQTITEHERTMVTTKRLYWRRTGRGNLLIVAEDNG
ncbi:MAG: L,D-transpeptidase family protein [Bacteroidetes bacterium]|nr:L,D-transpeptidase family protein [Bacteroidota bacterium]